MILKCDICKNTTNAYSKNKEDAVLSIGWSIIKDRIVCDQCSTKMNKGAKQ